MKNTARSTVERNILERAQVRALGAILPIPDQMDVAVGALATELGIKPAQVRRLARMRSGKMVDLDTARGVITAALDQLGKPDRVLRVHAQLEFDDMVWTTDLATWIGIPASEVFFREIGGWDAVAAAAEHGDEDDYEYSENGISYHDLANAYPGSDAAWTVFDSFASTPENGWIGYIEAERISDNLGVELPWPAKALMSAMADDTTTEDDGWEADA